VRGVLFKVQVRNELLLSSNKKGGYHSTLILKLILILTLTLTLTLTLLYDFISKLYQQTTTIK